MSSQFLIEGESRAFLTCTHLFYCSELATLEKALLALDPINRTVPTTRTRITANMTAYSAISCPASSHHSLRIILYIFLSSMATWQPACEKDGLAWELSATHDARVPRRLSNGVLILRVEGLLIGTTG